jgi:hypothetical protein
MPTWRDFSAMRLRLGSLMKRNWQGRKKLWMPCGRWSGRLLVMVSLVGCCIEAVDLRVKGPFVPVR